MKHWLAVILIFVCAGLLLWCMGRQYISAQQAMAQAAVAAEEAAKREQAAYYKGWQDGKNYYLENFGGAEWTQ
mgnify:CR=1 FL=1